ncbi:spindle and centriole-associated protein 1-like isoform X1 [Liolophura sinensis]|uniref:spindle and centriole-associated protein 1-like isoform X1 n=1 Tax=Liolophura sinensis TaxID=3198878 RepID=UPI00315931CF
MSFIRVGKPSGGLRRKRSGVRKKPAWDDSIQDLSVHRASLEDQMYRKVIHESKNSLKARLERLEKTQKKGKSPKATARQMAVMKEILYDQQQLHDVLSKSDEMMSVVQDIFGDNPKRFTGYPSVTAAPGNGETSKLVSLDADVQTQLEMLSQSIMDGTALNESTEEEEEDNSDDAPEPIVYQPRLNLDRFHQFLAAAQEQNGTLSTISGGAPVTISNGAGPSHSTKLPEGSGLSKDGSIFETPPQKKVPSRLQSPKSAANDTAKIRRSKKCVTSDEDGTSTAPLSLTDLKQVLISLQCDIRELEQQTGRSSEADQPHSESFSGYTMALVDSVSRLTRHLRETDRRLQAEMTIREQLTQDVVQLRTVVDALTSDIILTQEEYAKVVTEFGTYKTETQAEMEAIKAMLVKMSQGHPVKSMPYEDVSLTTGQPASPLEFTTPPKPTQQPLGEAGECVSDEASLLPPSLVRQGDILQPAILLSPPVQRTRLPDCRPVPQTTANNRGVSKLSESMPFQQAPAPPTAVVNVPKPVPLVQTNIPVNFFKRQGFKLLERQGDAALDQQPDRSTQSEATSQKVNPHVVPSNQSEPLHQQPVRSTQSAATFHRADPHIVPSIQSEPLSLTNDPSRESIPVSIGHSASAFRSVSGQSVASLGGASISANRVGDGQQHGLHAQIGIGQSSMTQESGDSKPVSDNPLLSAQIAELNRQHEEAQRRLQIMLQQQQQSLRLRSEESDKQASGPQSLSSDRLKQTNVVLDQVSPDVSPISERSSSVRGCLPAKSQQQMFPANQKTGVGLKPQHISVSVPTVELDLSGFSDVSPSPQLTTACQ